MTRDEVIEAVGALVFALGLGWGFGLALTPIVLGLYAVAFANRKKVKDGSSDR